jgi:hypothetical protein
VSDKKFLVRFPPRKRIHGLVKFHSINLKRTGDNVSFIHSEGEAEPFELFQEIWIKIEGIPLDGLLGNSFIRCPLLLECW